MKSKTAFTKHQPTTGINSWLDFQSFKHSFSSERTCMMRNTRQFRSPLKQTTSRTELSDDLGQVAFTNLLAEQNISCPKLETQNNDTKLFNIQYHQVKTKCSSFLKYFAAKICNKLSLQCQPSRQVPSQLSPILPCNTCRLFTNQPRLSSRWVIAFLNSPLPKCLQETLHCGACLHSQNSNKTNWAAKEINIFNSFFLQTSLISQHVPKNLKSPESTNIKKLQQDDGLLRALVVPVAVAKMHAQLYSWTTLRQCRQGYGHTGARAP